jgi:trehalose 6-phosphate synthase/phosphatase
MPERGLVVVSNRLPIAVRTSAGRTRIERAPGGLVAALEPALQRRGGTWVGWPGGLLPEGVELAPDAGYRIAPVQLTRTDVQRYYLGFSNRTLWPLLHSFPARMELAREEWNTYEKVNRRFANVAGAQLDGSELVWIHDYHLMRTAVHLRRSHPETRIAFFLHIPFPPFDLFRILPWDRQILRGLLACDLIGFHCQAYASNFLDCAERLLGARVERDTGRIEHGERTVGVGVFPLGIDCELFAKRAREASGRGPRGERVILGVDRLDYTKGIPEKIRAFERLLEVHPQHRERVVLLQIAEPSRREVGEYRRLKREVDELVGNVNGRFATSRWTPIRYLTRSISPEDLSGLYRDADVALVTPLRDGMNLVAKEYVACQVHEPGALVLSRLTGAAEDMHEALRVNPYDCDGVAEALHEALRMDVSERTERMRAMQQRERRNDVHAWLGRFLEAASAPLARMRPVQERDFEDWLGNFLSGRRLGLFLDYDGTLAEIVDHPSKARLAPAMQEALRTCAERDDTDVAIVSGRALADLRGLVDVPGLVLVGNHGLEIEGPGLEPFVHPELDRLVDRTHELAAALRGVRDPGVWLEEKGATLTLHYRGAAPADHERISERARALVRDAGFHPRDAILAVEARPLAGWDKGRAVLHVLRARYGPPWPEEVRVIYAGDDVTDEDAFRALQGLGLSFCVGAAERATFASRRLPNVDAVETLLRWIASRSRSV